MGDQDVGRKPKGNGAKSVGMRIRFTTKDRDLWRTLVARNGNWGSIFGKAFIDIISNQWRFKHSVLFCRFRKMVR